MLLHCAQNGVQFCYKISDRKKLWHRAEGLAEKIHIEAGNNYPNASQCKRFTNINNIIFEELSLVDANNIYVFTKLEYAGCMRYRG